MVRFDALSGAQVVLLAVRFTVDHDLSKLQILAADRTDILSQSVILRILLTYLPADTDDVASLATFITHLEHNFRDVSHLDTPVDTSYIENISPAEAAERLHNIRLKRLTDQSGPKSQDEDLLALFLTQWIYQAESVFDTLPLAARLVEAFVEGRPQLKFWYDTCVAPVLRLQNEFYPDRPKVTDVHRIEALHGGPGVKRLLQFAEQDGEKAHIGRDLTFVVAPWIHGARRNKRRKLDSSPEHPMQTSWHDVNDWIHSTSKGNFSLAAKAVLEWDGPDQENPAIEPESSQDEDISTAYSQTALALILNPSLSGAAHVALLRQLLDRAGSLASKRDASIAQTKKHTLKDATKGNLLENRLLSPQNAITLPSEETFEFLSDCLAAQELLESFKLTTTTSFIADIALFGSEERQKLELRRILQQIPRLTKSETDWVIVREQLKSLRSGDSRREGQSESRQQYKFLGHVSTKHLEQEILDAIIMAGRYDVVAAIYLETPDGPLSPQTVEEHFTSAIYNAYDNASNGNRTRGGVKKASDILTAAQQHFPNSTSLSQIAFLIKATHSMSFYQLTLQHGVPFQPVSIRVHRDPLTLIERILEQDHKAYTKLDDLLEIGRNLVRAGLTNAQDPLYHEKSEKEKLFDAQHRITYSAITSALTDQDFDTAYSYITTRLSTSPSQTQSQAFTDDTSWRAAYAAGRYRPSSSPKSLHDQITSLSKRMDLLSLALTLAPTPDPLSEILATWRRCEEEMDNLKSQAVEEERAFEGKTTGSSLPGGFGPEDHELDAAETRRMMERRAMGGNIGGNSAGPTYEEEAPMGLFDVARGAASAFRKSAFPLSSARGDQRRISSGHSRNVSGSDARSEHSSDGALGGEQRVRKRDMVSNMVTGGLVSGMSWVLGAPTSNTKQQQQQHE